MFCLFLHYICPFILGGRLIDCQRRINKVSNGRQRTFCTRQTRYLIILKSQVNIYPLSRMASAVSAFGNASDGWGPFLESSEFPKY